MLKVKHLMDEVEPDDGVRIWVEPMGLTRDLCEWCCVDEVMPGFGPPYELWVWFEQHPDGYECFRGRYHEHLEGNRRPALHHLAWMGTRYDVTLLHQGTDPRFNTGTALFEYLTELACRLPSDL